MPASLTWIDHDAQAYQRSQRILALFSERDTRDELGLGSIRDTFADALFPGTSTIQTRLRYMLFIPWMYRSLENKRVKSARIGIRVREYETGLIGALSAHAGDGDVGIIGSSAGDSLKRLPSAIYWAGLREWGIREYPGSQQQYHDELDHIYERRRLYGSHRDVSEELGDDVGGLWEANAYTWHPGLPEAPSRFPDEASLRLTPEEAGYVQERVRQAQPNSLLSWLLLHPRRVAVDYPWRHPDLGAFSGEIRNQLKQAELFSLVMHGASILYNVLLAELSGRESLLEEHKGLVLGWQAQLQGHEGQVSAWARDLMPFWEVVGKGRYNVGARTRGFVEAWVERVVTVGGHVLADDASRRLVQKREEEKKRANSRFINARARDQWSGYSGLGRLDFRWNSAKVYIDDIVDALGG